MVMEFNLLPYRDARRVRQRMRFFWTLALSCALGILGALVLARVFDVWIMRQKESNDIAKADLKQWDQKIKQVVTLQAEVAALKKRQHSIDLLQSQKYLPVHFMHALTEDFPVGIQLTKVLQSVQGILISGDATTSDAIFTWMRHLAQNSSVFSNPELLEMRAGNPDVGESLHPPRVRFNLRLQLISAAAEPVAADWK